MQNSSKAATRTGHNLLLLAACFFCAGTLVAQKDQQKRPPEYNLQAEIKMKAIVDEVRFPPKGNDKEIAYLLIKNGTETVDVYLCPKSFLDDMGIGFAKGDELALTGSKVQQDGVDLILVREVVRGNETFVLRDEKGSPVWK